MYNTTYKWTSHSQGPNGYAISERNQPKTCEKHTTYSARGLGKINKAHPVQFTAEL